MRRVCCTTILAFFLEMRKRSQRRVHSVAVMERVAIGCYSKCYLSQLGRSRLLQSPAEKKLLGELSSKVTIRVADKNSLCCSSSPDAKSSFVTAVRLMRRVCCLGLDFLLEIGDSKRCRLITAF